jgi:hypothetical protein
VRNGLPSFGTASAWSAESYSHRTERNVNITWQLFIVSHICRHYDTYSWNTEAKWFALLTRIREVSGSIVCPETVYCELVVAFLQYSFVYNFTTLKIRHYFVPKSCKTGSDLKNFHLCLIYFYTSYIFYTEPGYRSRYSDWLGTGRPRGRSSGPGRVKNVLFFKSSRPALGPTQPPIQWVPRAHSPGVKEAGVWSWPLTSS